MQHRKQQPLGERADSLRVPHGRDDPSNLIRIMPAEGSGAPVVTRTAASPIPAVAVFFSLNGEILSSIDAEVLRKLAV